MPVHTDRHPKSQVFPARRTSAEGSLHAKQLVTGWVDGHEETEFFGALVTIAESNFMRMCMFQKTEALKNILEQLRRCERSIKFEKRNLENQDVDVDQTIFTMCSERDRLNQEKMAVEQQIEDYQVKMRQSVPETRDAEAKIEAAMTTLRIPVGKAERVHSLKKNLMQASKQICPSITEGVQALGRLWLRTPAFLFQQTSILGHLLSGEGTILVRDFLARTKLDDFVPICINAQTSRIWDIVEYIDKLAEDAAYAQCQNSIRVLWGILASDEFPTEVHEHLVRVVCDAWQKVEQADTALRTSPINSSQKRYQSAVALCWPKEGDVQMPAYQVLMDLLKVSGMENMELGKRDFCGERLNEELTPLERSLSQLDNQFVYALQADSLMHLTACHGVKVLCKVMNRAIVQLKTEEAFLYDHDPNDAPGARLNNYDNHWFHRRHATSRICMFAEQGNQLAVRVMVDLLNYPHWMIRQLVLPHVTSTIGRLCPKGGQICTLVREAVETICLMALVVSEAEDTTIAQRLTYNRKKGISGSLGAAWERVRTTAEKSLTEDMPSYSPELRAYVVKTLTKQCNGRAERKSIYDRIVKNDNAFGADSTYHEEMRIACQRQKYIDLMEANRKNVATT